MGVTTPQADSDDAIRDVARRSMRGSYSVSPEILTAITETEFSDDRLETYRNNDDEILLASTQDGELTGFVTGTLDGDDGNITWLHVAPEARGQGLGTDLFEAGRDELQERGADTVRAVVFGKNEEGGQFFEQFGYERIGNSNTEIDDQTFSTYIYGPEGEEIDEERHTPDTVDTDDGTVYTGDEELAGEQAPFLVLYTDEDRTERYGFFCTNCGTLANAADDQGRIDCGTCGNESRPDDWDAAYL